MTDFAAAAAAYTGRSIATLFLAKPPLVALSQDASGVIAITLWDASLGAQPTLARLEAAVSAPTSAALIAYAQEKQFAIETGGISVNIAAAGAPPQMLEVATDADGKIKLLGAVQGTSLLAAAGAAPTVNYIQPAGIVTLSQSQAQTVGLAAFAFVASTEDVLGEVLAAIASAVITTTAQIDDPTTVALSAWPVNS